MCVIPLVKITSCSTDTDSARANKCTVYYIPTRMYTINYYGIITIGLTNFRRNPQLCSRSPSVPVVCTLWSALDRTSSPHRETVETTLGRARNPVEKIHQNVSYYQYAYNYYVRIMYHRSFFFIFFTLNIHFIGKNYFYISQNIFHYFLIIVFRTDDVYLCVKI